MERPGQLGTKGMDEVKNNQPPCACDLNCAFGIMQRDCLVQIH